MRNLKMQCGTMQYRKERMVEKVEVNNTLFTHASAVASSRHLDTYEV